MGSSVVAARVDSDIKARADLYIAKAGLTQASVIRNVWQRIAETGEVPLTEESGDRSAALKERMRELRNKTPNSKYLAELTPEMLKEELSSRG